MVKPILETGNLNDIYMYFCFIYSWMKNSKKNTMEIKKNNSKCTNFTMKNVNKTDQT